MALAAASTSGAAFQGALRDMHPAYFAMAMATGIVSIACHLLGFRTIATLLFWLNDRSEGFTATWAFLDRRIEDVMRIEKLKRMPPPIG